MDVALSLRGSPPCVCRLTQQGGPSMLCPTALQAQAVLAAGVTSKHSPLLTRLQCCLQQTAFTLQSTSHKT